MISGEMKLFKNINLYNLEKWTKMLMGKSILHVNQGVGKCYSIEGIQGYYNDLTEKVLRDNKINEIDLPTTKIESREVIYFPIAIFQYGLGAYDLYLLTRDKKNLKKFFLCADWALYNQMENGAWNTFGYKYPDSPYSAMAQGEGVSLLIRAFIESENEKYLNAAKKAIKFMLLPIENGGTTLYKQQEIYLKEYTHLSTVLNGWIFAVFGLFDYVKLSNDKMYKVILEKTLNTLKNNLEKFDNGYWSKYNMDKAIASPFYHKLHIAQLDVLYKLFGFQEFKHYRDLWNDYARNKTYKTRAFIVKAYQKLTEN